MQLTVTPLQSLGVEVLPPDIVWDGFVGDFAVSTVPADGGVGGLVARNPIQTAVLLLLFTDKQCAASELTFVQQGDRRGWVGDGFDVDTANGEAPLGSKLWLYRRSALTAQTPTLVKAEILSALQPLIDQKAVVEIDVTTEVLPGQNQLRVAVDIYGRNKAKTYSLKFDALWKRADGL